MPPPAPLLPPDSEAAVHAWLTAADAGSAARAKAFVIAFGVRDTIWMFTFLLTALRVSEYSDQLSEFWLVYTPILYVSTVIVYVPLVAYGMLRTQLFDIDLRIKRTLKRSTVLAAFVAVFFILVAVPALVAPVNTNSAGIAIKGYETEVKPTGGEL